MNSPLQPGGYLSSPSQSGTHSYVLTPENEIRGGERGGVMNSPRPPTKSDTILNDVNIQPTFTLQRFNDEGMPILFLFSFNVLLFTSPEYLFFFLFIVFLQRFSIFIYYF